LPFKRVYLKYFSIEELLLIAKENIDMFPSEAQLMIGGIDRHIKDASFSPVDELELIKEPLGYFDGISDVDYN